MTTAATSTAILVSGRRFRLFQLAGSLFILLACVTSSYVPNPHWLFLTHTLFHGIGSSCILSVVGLIVNEYFDKQHRHHILATTLVSGGSIASIVFVEMYAYLIETYTWRTAFLILGGIYLVVNLSGVVFFCKNSAKQDNHSSNNSCLGAIREIERRKLPYLGLWFFDRVMTSIVTYGLLLNLADYVKRRESILTKSTHLTMLFASGEASTYAIAAVIAAFTKDLLLNRLKYILIACTALLAAMLALWELCASYDGVSKLLAFLCGFGLGPSITFLFPAGEELTTLPGHLAYPFSLAGMGVGMALSPFVTALIAEAYEYRGFFLIQAFLIFLKLLALCSIVLLQKLVLGPGDIEYEAVTLEELNRDGEAKKVKTKNGRLSTDELHHSRKYD